MEACSLARCMRLPRACKAYYKLYDETKTMKILIIFFVVLIFAIQQPDLFSYSSGLHALRPQNAQRDYDDKGSAVACYLPRCHWQDWAQRIGLVLDVRAKVVVALIQGACLVGRVAVAGLCVRVRQKARLVVKHASGSGEALLR